MSQLTDLYEGSDKKRPQESNQIPGKETDFWDRDHKFSDGFKINRKKGDEPKFTKEALDHYNTKKGDLTPPESFDQAFPLHRYTPENSFFNPGAKTT